MVPFIGMLSMDAVADVILGQPKTASLGFLGVGILPSPENEINHDIKYTSQE